MNTYLEALLLNMLSLVVFLLFIPHIIESHFKKMSRKHKKLLKLASAIIAMVSCMFFPFRIGEDIIMDLRSVAIMVGGLYLGRKAGVTLVVIFLTFRLLVGGLGSGFYASFIASVIIVIVLTLLPNFFERATKRTKLIIACNLSLFISSLALFIRSILFNHLISSDYMAVAAFFIIHVLTTFFIFYFYEILRETVYVNKQIIKAEKIEIVSHLASSISHEVRNPLTVVKGFLQMLNQKQLAEDKRNMYITLSLQEINRANDIIGNYLTFAKPAREEHTVVDLKQELNRSIDVIHPLANMNCIDIQTNIERCYIKGDPHLLHQCFLNITKNCIEAMPNGGKLFIKTEELNDEIVIEITDTGEGMSKEQIRRLGEPFYTTKGREGTGLGMMAVIKIIEMMNGTLNVKSNLNEGTQFRIYFPRTQ